MERPHGGNVQVKAATSQTRAIARLCFGLFSALLYNESQALTCRVIGVSDGDTITALCQDFERLKVRLAEIDAPEKAQAFGTASKQSLAGLCFGRDAEIIPIDTDRYGRTVARVRCDGVNANAAQVRQGMAWVYEKYARDRVLYQLQDEARTARRGLWADDSAKPPWQWRKDRAK